MSLKYEPSSEPLLISVKVPSTTRLSPHTYSERDLEEEEGAEDGHRQPGLYKVDLQKSIPAQIRQFIVEKLFKHAFPSVKAL